MSDVYDELRIPIVARVAGVVQIMASLTLFGVALQAGSFGGWIGILVALGSTVGGLVGFALGGWLTQGRGIAAILTVLVDLATLFALVSWFVIALLTGVITILPLFAFMFVGFATLLVAVATPGSLRLDAARRELLK